MKKRIIQVGLLTVWSSTLPKQRDRDVAVAVSSTSVTGLSLNFLPILGTTLCVTTREKGFVMDEGLKHTWTRVGDPPLLGLFGF